MALSECTAICERRGWPVLPQLHSLHDTLNPSQQAQLLGMLVQIDACKQVGAASAADASPHPAPAADSGVQELLASVFLEVPNVACIAPRGRWDVLFAPDAVLFRNKKGILNVVSGCGICFEPIRTAFTDRFLDVHTQVKRSQVSHIAHFELPSLSKHRDHVFLLACAEPITLAGLKKMPTVLGIKVAGADAQTVATWPTSSPIPLHKLRAQAPASHSAAARVAFEDLTCTTPQLLALLLECVLAPLDNAKNTDFRNSQGGVSLSVTQRIDTGSLHLFNSGLAFGPKPLLWLPYASMLEVRCEDRGYGAQARYWDLVLRVKDQDKPVEFSNISAEERGAVMQFLQAKVRADTAADGQEAAGEEGGAGDDGGSSDEGSAFSEEGHSSDGSSGDDSDSDGSEATFASDSDVSVEFVDEEAGALSGTEDVAAEARAELAGAQRVRHSRARAAAAAAAGTGAPGTVVGGTKRDRDSGDSGEGTKHARV